MTTKHAQMLCYGCCSLVDDGVFITYMSVIG